MLRGAANILPFEVGNVFPWSEKYLWVIYQVKLWINTVHVIHVTSRIVSCVEVKPILCVIHVWLKHTCEELRDCSRFKQFVHIAQQEYHTKWTQMDKLSTNCVITC